MFVIVLPIGYNIRNIRGREMNESQLIFTLFGATGDLADRKLYPALYRLYKDNRISQKFAVIGTARREWSDDYFREKVYNSIQEEINNEEHAKEFISHFYYQAHDVHDAHHYGNLKNLSDKLDKKYDIGGNRIYYISLNPQLFPVITQNLKSQGVLTDNGYNRLIIEKPFGFDEKSAIELQKQLTSSFEEHQIYRIDHYLGKELLSSLDEFRFNNIWEHMWSNQYIDNVQISLAEDMGIGARGAYYDHSGVTKDMIQNHLMQILSIVAMKRPSNASSDAFRQEKINIIEALKPYRSIEELTQNVVRGQYTANPELDIRGYLEEEGVEANSHTETFFAAKFEIDLPNWQGVPFFVRSGKRIDGKYSTIHIVFKPVSEDVESNYLRIELNPEMKIQYFYNQEKPGYKSGSKVVPMTFKYKSDLQSTIPHDYERLISGCINNQLDHFVHWFEAKYAWKFIDHIHEYWHQLDGKDLKDYPALSTGPQEADLLTQAHGTKWYDYQ